MERNVKYLLLRKIDVLKTSIFSETILEEMHLTSKSKNRYKVYSGNVYIGIIVFTCLSSTKPCLRILLNCFVREIKGFYQSSFRNEVEFGDIMTVSLNTLARI